MLANGWWSEAEMARREARLCGLADTNHHSTRTSVRDAGNRDSSLESLGTETGGDRYDLSCTADPNQF